MARRINTMDDWGTPEEMEARRWLTGEYLDQAGYQNPNDRINRGELPKTYNDEMRLNDRAYKAYVDWVQNNSEGQVFANSEGSPMYAQRIENAPRPTTKLGPIELPPELVKPTLGKPSYSGMRAPNVYSAAGYTYPEFAEEYYNNNGGVDMKPWEEERYYGAARSNAELEDELRRYHSELPENSVDNAKTWKERNRNFMDRFERQEELQLPTTHFEDSRIQPQKLYDAERANSLNDSYRRYMNGQRNGRIEPLFDTENAREVTNDWYNLKAADTYEARNGMRDFKQPKNVFVDKYNLFTDSNGFDNIKPVDDLKVREARSDFFGKQAPESSATTDSMVDEYLKGDWREKAKNATGDEMFSEAELNEMADNLKRQTTQEASKKNKKTDLVDEYYEGEMPKQIERSLEKANYKQNKIDNTKKSFDEFNAQRAGAKPYGNPYSKEGMRYQNGSGQRAPYFNASAFGAVAPAAHAVNFAMQHPTQATIATGLGLTGIAASNLVHNGMDAAMAYEAASQMVADAQAKYQDFIANGYGEEAAAYFSGLADLIAQQRVEQGID